MKNTQRIGILLAAGLLTFSSCTKKSPSATPTPHPTIQTPAPTVVPTASEPISYKEQDILLKITSPQNDTTVTTEKIIINGITAANAEVFINNMELKADDKGGFSTQLNLHEGENNIFISANNKKGEASTEELILNYTPANQSLTELIDTNIEMVSANSLVVSKDKNTYTINVTPNTKILTKYGSISDLIEYSTGHKLNIWGTTNEASKSAITAKVIKNNSIQKRIGIFYGLVDSISGRTFTFSSKIYGQNQITIDASTKIVNNDNTPITASDIHENDRIKIIGSIDQSVNKITAAKAIKNFSQPKPDSSQSATLKN